MVPLLAAVVDFDSSQETYERYDSMTALELFQKCVRPLLIDLPVSVEESAMIESHSEMHWGNYVALEASISRVVFACNEDRALAASALETAVDIFLVSSQGDEHQHSPPYAGLE